MSGTESKSDQQRCAIWDVLWKQGAQEPRNLAKQVSLGVKEINRLVDHDWFLLVNGFVYIAMLGGTDRQVQPKVYY